jgi:hypothetical protein
MGNRVNTTPGSSYAEWNQLNRWYAKKQLNRQNCKIELILLTGVMNTLTQTLRLNQDEAKAVLDGLNVVESHSLGLLSVAHYELSVPAKECALTVAKLLTGEMPESEFTQDNWRKMPLLPQKLWENKKEPLTTIHYQLYQSLSKLAIFLA